MALRCSAPPLTGALISTPRGIGRLAVPGAGLTARRSLAGFPATRQGHRPMGQLHSMLKASNKSQSLVTDAYQRLQGKEVIRSSDAARLDLPSLWGPDDVVVVAWGRSLGELAIQLRRDVKPQLDAMNAKLFLVSIGTHERSKDFHERTGFPRELLFVDPEHVTYEALQLVKGVRQTFFSYDTAFSFLKRIKEKSLKDLGDVLKNWQPWVPPQQSQAFQQGGMFVFKGTECLFSHKDQATGAHADYEEVLEVVRRAVAQPSIAQ